MSSLGFLWEICLNAFGVKVGYFGEQNPKRMPAHLFFGARRMNYRTAQRADVSRQNYTICPRHWYVDATFKCCNCGEEFVFTASEQRFWYEDLHFWIDSLPKRCPTCRKSERTKLELRKRYDILIADALADCPAETKKQLIEIINQLEAAQAEIPERMKQNRATLYSQLANKGT